MISGKKNNDFRISVEELYGYPTVLKIRQRKQRGHEKTGQDPMSRDWDPKKIQSHSQISGNCRMNGFKNAAIRYRRRMKMFNRILEILSVPIMFLNFAGGIVGGIWLAFLGEWKRWNWYCSSFYIALDTFYINDARNTNCWNRCSFYEKKNPLSHIFGYLSQLYTNILIVGTCVLAFFICSSFYRNSIGFGYIPYLLWSWGMALGPWQFLHRRA